MPYTGIKLQRYYSWKNLKARAGGEVSTEWKNFEQFFKATENKPGERYQMRRLDHTKPWGSDNFEWYSIALADSFTKDQRKEYHKARRQANPDMHRESRYKRKYGISLSQYKELLAAQDHKCAICNKEETQSQQGTVRQLAVDHCHKTGKVRGLLCNNCNAVMGHAGDSIGLLLVIIAYLRKHQSSS